MSDNCIYITENDLVKLKALVRSSKISQKRDEKSLQLLEGELNRANVVKHQDIPSDVITMNSEIHLIDMDSQEETIYRLVFPHEADIDKGYVSILAPIGTALIGYKVGDIIEWNVPAGTAKWKVMKITYQPEAAGDLHL
jgi:regulator of nucleoside diphosphate kinase